MSLNRHPVHRTPTPYRPALLAASDIDADIAEAADVAAKATALMHLQLRAGSRHGAATHSSTLWETIYMYVYIYIYTFFTFFYGRS